MNSPFKFLDAYTLQDREVFFGRDKEVDALYNLLYSTPLVLVHGLSGTGKTSLVQCGLASRYEGPEWYPFFIRRGQKDINTALREELQEALPGQPVGEDFPAFIRQVVETYYSPVYLIFDQFEEVFILGSPQERQAFADNLKAILDAELSCKVLLVMREEYLGRLYDFEQKIPYLFDFRLRIEPMNMARVREVLQQSFAAFNISLEEPEADRLDEIITNVSGERSGIELPYLQVYLDLLWKEDFQRTYRPPPTSRQIAGTGSPKEGSFSGELPSAVSKASPQPLSSTTPPPSEGAGGRLLPSLEFTKQEIASFGKIEDVLEKFLLQQEQQLQKELAKTHTGLPPNTVRMVVDLFVTEEGTKQPLRFQRDADSKQVELEERARQLVPNLSAAALSDCLDALEQRRLLRFLDDTIELAHDKLAALIHEQRTEEQRRLARARARLRFALEEYRLSGAFLSREQLEGLEEYLPQLPKEEEMEAFLEANRAQLDEQEREEERRRQRELELTQAKLVAEERARKRQRFFSIVVSLVALVAIAAGIYAFGQSRIVRQQSRSLQQQSFDNEVGAAVALKSAEQYKAALAQLAGLEERAETLGKTGYLDSIQSTWKEVSALTARADSLAQKSQTAEDIRQWPRARQYYTDALDLDPENEQLKDKREALDTKIKNKAADYYNRASNICNFVHFEHAKPLFELAKALDPGNEKYQMPLNSGQCPQKTKK